MKLSQDINLGLSLMKVFGNDRNSIRQVEQDRDRQTATAKEILHRYFTDDDNKRELVLLADEVGLGKTYVGLAVAVSILDAIRRDDAPEGLPVNKPVVLILTPNNEALYNKWLREAEAFKHDCGRQDDSFEWLQVCSPTKDSSQSGNVIDLAITMRDATRSSPMLLIAKQSVFGRALHDREQWRRRALAIIFDSFNIRTEERPAWCRQILGSGSMAFAGDLRDLRSSYYLWQDTDEYSRDLYSAYQSAINIREIREEINNALITESANLLTDAADNLTRFALAGSWNDIPLLIIDEIHGLKNEYVRARKNIERFLSGSVHRLLGLSATPFQLHHDELLSILNLRKILSLSSQRRGVLDNIVEKLDEVMKSARDAGDNFRRRWITLRPVDEDIVNESWHTLCQNPDDIQRDLARQIRPHRIAYAFEAAMNLEQSNRRLKKHLSPFVIRHHHPRGYREYFVGRRSVIGDIRVSGSRHFGWEPGLDVTGNEELIHYLMMRSVALAKDEKGLPGLGAELTGSYRHLIETSAVWYRLSNAKNQQLKKYREILGNIIKLPDADIEHSKVKATVKRALEFFKQGQKTLIFCVYTKTADTIRDHLQQAIDEYLNMTRDRVFGDEKTFDNFRRRFFNRRETLYSMMQDHPLLGKINDGEIGVPEAIRLDKPDLREVAQLLLDHGELPNIEKSDRRLIQSAVEQVVIKKWRNSEEGTKWLRYVLQECPELEDIMTSPHWLQGREPLSRSERSSRGLRTRIDPEAFGQTIDPLEIENADDSNVDRKILTSPDGIEGWLQRFRRDIIGGIIAPYAKANLASQKHKRLPLLIEYHGEILREFDLQTRIVAGQVFRRILMAEEFLLRYLADVEREHAEFWSDYLADRYTEQLQGHRESLRDRVHAYFETLLRARKNQVLLEGYYSAAENRNVVQLVKGGTQYRDRYFLGFNTPYRPEIIVSTSVGQEGIDLHRECRHVIHHDLCWNPATIEQRTGRVDRIGSKVERERAGVEDDNGPTLEIVIPYLAATYDERMFEELFRRAQLFEVTMGGDFRVDGRIDHEQHVLEKRTRNRFGIGTEDEDIGYETDELKDTIELPNNMVDKLRVDLSVWKNNK